MKRFDDRGMLIIPDPAATQADLDARPRQVLVVRECFCPKGHSLLAPRTSFNGRPGIRLGARQGDATGSIVLSPVFGQKIRVALDIDLTEGEPAELFCPTCETVFPTHSPCHCGADVVTLFRDPTGDFANCIGLCHRIGCPNAGIICGTELLTSLADLVRNEPPGE
jgi:hypothetical protein